MTVAARIKQLLDTNRIKHRVLQHARVANIGRAVEMLDIPAEQTIKAQVLGDELGMVLVVIPSLHKLDLPKVCQILNRKHLIVLSTLKTNRLFSDCDAGCWPPIGRPYGLETIFDQSLSAMQQVYFTSGSHTGLIQMQADDFRLLDPKAKYFSISIPFGPEPNLMEQEVITPAEYGPFPKLPGIASKLLRLSLEGKHSIRELIELVSQDEHIQQQILLYTELPFVQGKLTQHDSSIDAIVEHVLGFDMVSHIALGVAAGRAFNQSPATDTAEFWRHAFYAASYAERITQLVASDQQLDPAISYLAGLFHNFGLLLISQIYPPEYSLLKKWLQINPKTSISILEQRLLGMGRAFEVLRGGHAHLGESLLRFWQMPDAICVIAREHHSLNYIGEYSAYVKIIQITNQLLRENGIGDGTATGLNAVVLAELGLDEQQIRQTISAMPDYSSRFDLMAHSLSKK